MAENYKKDRKCLDSDLLFLILKNIEFLLEKIWNEDERYLQTILYRMESKGFNVLLTNLYYTRQ